MQRFDRTDWQERVDSIGGIKRVRETIVVVSTGYCTRSPHISGQNYYEQEFHAVSFTVTRSDLADKQFVQVLAQPQKYPPHGFLLYTNLSRTVPFKNGDVHDQNAHNCSINSLQICVSRSSWELTMEYCVILWQFYIYKNRYLRFELCCNCCSAGI